MAVNFLSTHGSPMPTPRSSAELTRGVIRAPDYEPAQYPNDVVNFRQYIIHEELPEDTRQGSQLLVFVRKVNSPWDFWINLSGPMYSAKLNSMCHEMRNFYELRHEDYVMPPYAVVYGQFCVCLYRNEWHRARILHVSDSTCEVSLVDFGGTVLMNHENLRFMHKKFSDLPMQSFRAEIYDVKPRQSESWSNTVCEWFRMQTAGRRFIAEVKEICSQKHSLKIKLFDGSRQSISQLLVSLDMAEVETSTAKSACEAREISQRPTPNKSILSAVCAAALARTPKSRLNGEDRQVTLRSESLNLITDNSRLLLDKHTANNNSVTTTVPHVVETKVPASKTGQEWHQRDIKIHHEICNLKSAALNHDTRELLHKQSVNENTLPARSLVKVPTSKLVSESGQRDSKLPSEASNGSSNWLQNKTENKNATYTASSGALGKVAIPRTRLEWDESDSTPISTKTSISLEDVTISGNNLLVVKLEGSDHFVLSEFLDSFVGIHEHVALKIFEALHSSIRLVKLSEPCMWIFLAQLRGRTVAGVNTDYKRKISPIHLLPLCEVNELINFLKLDGSEIEDLQYFLLSLL